MSREMSMRSKIGMGFLIEELIFTLFRKVRKWALHHRAHERSARSESVSETVSRNAGSELIEGRRSTLHLMADGRGLLTRWQKGPEGWGWYDVPLSRGDVRELKQKFK